MRAVARSPVRGRLAASKLVLLAVLVASAACVEEVEVLDSTADVAAEDVTLAAELWARDPLRRTVDLRSGEYGLEVRGGDLVNRSSHLGFGLPNAGVMEIGIQRHETGVLLDLGTDEDLGATLGADSGFVALDLEGDRFNHAPADALFAELDRIAGGEDGGAASRVVPVAGHVLVGALVREAGSTAAADEALLVKILVVDHRPETQLVIRWSVLTP